MTSERKIKSEVVIGYSKHWAKSIAEITYDDGTVEYVISQHTRDGKKMTFQTERPAIDIPVENTDD